MKLLSVYKVVNVMHYNLIETTDVAGLAVLTVMVRYINNNSIED
jgi:hypothetical protein